MSDLLYFVRGIVGGSLLFCFCLCWNVIASAVEIPSFLISALANLVFSFLI